MAECFLIQTGGGTSLNFKVVGNPQPTSPKENTIWVNTDVPITEYYFSSNQPENTAEGKVWIATGTASTAEFNALKKNAVQIYPMYAKQYVSGAWVAVAAMVYQSGAWKAMWNGELYIAGNEYEAVTGGWITHGMGYSSAYMGQNDLSVTRNPENIYAITPDFYKGGVLRPANAIDLTKFSTLHFDGVTNSEGHNARICIWSSIGEQSYENEVASIGNAINGEATLNVSSLEGKYYIGIFLYNSRYVTMRKMWLT